jgi:hypothetical protein
MANATNVAQVRKLNYNGEDIGMGFNSDTGLAIGTCLDFNPPSGDLSQEATSDVTIITSHEDLMSKLHMASELEGHYAFASASGKVDYATSTQYNSSSTFVVARMVLANTVSRGRNFKLKPEFQHLLDTDPDAFNRAFGDSFVRAQYKGGEFYAVMRITSVDSKTESNLAISLQADVQSGAAGGSFKGDLETANKSEKSRSEFTAKFYQKGGAGENEIGTTLDVAEIKTRLHNFPNAVTGHPFPYFIEVATYDTVPLPLPSKEQQDDFLLAISDADSRKLRYLQARNDCDFAAESPEYFSDPPTPAVLRGMSSIYTQLVNAVIAHALGVSRGDIPPSLFDPSRLTPPLTEPNLVLRKRDVGLENSFADFWVNKDKPATRKSDHDLTEDIGALAASQLNDFSTIADPGGDPAKTAVLQGEALARVIASFREYDWDHAGVHPVDRGRLQSLSGLPAMLPKTIQSLKFPQNAIQDTKGLDQFSALISLDLSHNAISSITELGSLPALRELQIVDNSISDLGPLATCKSLESLDISGNQIADLTALGSCKALKNLTLFGTALFVNGVARPTGNPITNVLALAKVLGMANPFTTGTVLSVRYGTLTDGPDAQFTGTATRIANSHSFRVHLTRGAEVVDDVWTLRQISAVGPSLAEDMKLFFPTVTAGDAPQEGISLNIHRESDPSTFQINFSFVDPANPKKSGIDLVAYPAFGTKIKLPTFDAAVVS